MNVNCPYCDKQLKITGKVEATITQMAPGKLIRVKCTGCESGFGINSEGGVAKLSANGEEKKKNPASDSSKILKADGKRTGKVVTPPNPPDLAWLEEGVFEDDEVVEEIPLALVLMQDCEERNSIIDAIEGIGYRAEVVQTEDQAIEKMLFVNYSNVVLHSKFSGAGILSSRFHEYMSKMDMSKRRYIFYTLVGPEFKTLYNLQALSYSANLVVNDTEVKSFNVILRKVIPEYEALFGPLMEELHIQRK